jgi:predicted NAD/FAD-dependent oxidoreductase
MLGLKIFKPSTNETVSEYLYRRNINQKLITWLFEPITLATINTSIFKASAQLLVTVLEKALLGGGTKSAFVLPTNGLSQLFSHSDILYENSKTSITVKSIRKSEHTFEILDSNDTIYNSSSIVFATPLSTTKSLLSDLEINLPKFDEHSPITSVYLWFDEEVLTEIEDSFFGMIGTITQWVFNKYKIENRTSNFAKSLLSTVISASDEIVSLSKDEITTMIYTELSEVFPSIKSSNVIHSVVIKEKKATFLSTPSFELERLRTSTSKEGIVIAGDWTNTGLPATMEGAALSGVTASREVLKFLQKL